MAKKETSQEITDRVINDPIKIKKQMEQGEQMTKYLMRVEPTEEAVNVLLDLGYSLAAITPSTQEFIKNGVYKSLETVLVYHFLYKGGKK